MGKMRILFCTVGYLCISGTSSYSGGGIMTEAHLEKIIKISDEIKRYKKFLEAFDKPYMNQIVACNWNGDKRADRFLLCENEPELEKSIRDYVVKKIETLEKEFSEL